MRRDTTARSACAIAALAFATALAAAAEPCDLRVMTFNIRYDSAGDGANVWVLRRHLVAGELRVHHPDVAGLQEALRHQIDYLAAELPQLAWFGEGRDGGSRGEHCPILYRRDRFELVDHGTFWLSRHPERSGPDWGAHLSRICTWGRLRERTKGAEVLVFNTHLDHQSGEARRRSAAMLLERIASIAGDLPAVLVGDLNCNERSQPHRILVTGATDEGAERGPEVALRDAAEVSETPAHGPAGTWIGFGNAQSPGERIDHILVKNEMRVTGYAVMAESWHGRTASDHLPVVADLRAGDGDGIRVLQLRTGWRFRVDPERGGREQGWSGRELDDGEWQLVRAGEPWELQGVEHDGVAWYRRVVHVPESWEGSRILLDLPGVDDAAVVFVDGEEVAKLGDGKSSLWDDHVTVELPGLGAAAGRDVLLAIEVTDWRTWGGLVGHPVALRIER